MWMQMIWFVGYRLPNNSAGIRAPEHTHLLSSTFHVTSRDVFSWYSNSLLLLLNYNLTGPYCAPVYIFPSIQFESFNLPRLLSFRRYWGEKHLCLTSLGTSQAINRTFPFGAGLRRLTYVCRVFLDAHWPGQRWIMLLVYLPVPRLNGLLHSLLSLWLSLPISLNVLLKTEMRPSLDVFCELCDIQNLH